MTEEDHRKIERSLQFYTFIIICNVCIVGSVIVQDTDRTAAISLAVLALIWLFVGIIRRIVTL